MHSADFLKHLNISAKSKLNSKLLRSQMGEKHKKIFDTQIQSPNQTLILQYFFISLYLFLSRTVLCDAGPDREGGEGEHLHYHELLLVHSRLPPRPGGGCSPQVGRVGIA